MVPAFTWYTGCPEQSFLEGVPTWSLDLTFYPPHKIFYHQSSGPWHRKRHFEAINVQLLANEDVFLAGDLPRCFIEEVSVLQAILTVSEVTTGAALTGVTNLKAAPEVTQTKPF